MNTPSILATTIASLLLASRLFAVTDTWDGGGADNNISTALNWLDNTAPVSDLALTDLVFDGTVKLSPNFSAPFSASTITFNNNAAVNAFTFGAGSALTVGGIIVNNDAQTQTFNNVVNVGSASANFVASAGALAFANIGLGTSALSFNAQAGASGITAVTGTGTITKFGAGSLNFGAAGAVTQSWDFVENAGAFNLNGSTDLTVSTTGSISVSGGVYNANGNVTMNATPFALSGAGAFTVASGKTLTLQNGASLTSSGVAVQHNTPGTITATGSGTVVSAGADSLFVNGSGSTLNVLAGADATFQNLVVGNVGTSTVLFDGAGTTATASANGSVIGNGATGLVTFRNGAAGSFGTLNVATSPSSTGQLTIQSGATVAVAGVVMVDDILAVETGTITVDGAGSAFSITGAGTMAAGAAGPSVATINVQNSGTFNTGTGLTTLNTTGTVNITSGGTFNANGNITLNGGDLARDAGSIFNVASGRTLTVQNGSLASFAGNQGFFGASAVVTGAGSAMTSSGGNLNFSGGGTISVNSGGHLDSSNAINFAVAGGLHTVTVDGAGSQLSAPGGSNLGDLGGTANVTFSNNAVGNFGGTLRLGESIIAGSTGTLLVQSGADVTSAQLLIASTAAAGTTGAVTVTGAGSTWTVSGGSQVNVGATSGSNGTLTIGTGGVFTSGSGNVTVNATGTLAIAGGTYNSNGTLLVNGGQFTRSNPGTLNLALGTQMTVQAGGDAIFTGLIQQLTRANLAINGAGSTLTTGGDFQWEGANSTLSLISVSNGGLLSSGGSLHLGRNNTAVALTANGAGAQIMSSPFFTSEWQAGVLLINGASATLGALRLADIDFGSTSFGSLNVQSGATASIGNINAASVTAQATAAIDVTGPGSAITQTGASALTLGAAFLSSATLNVNSGGAFTSGTGAVTLNPTGAINIGGGALTLLGPLARNGGALTFTSGALSIIDNWNVGPGGLLGQNVTFDATRRMATSATTTVDFLQTLTLNGGTLSTGALVNNGAIDFQRGALAITGAGGFAIGSGALGANVTLGTGSTLQVTNTATVANGASLVVDGGGASFGALNNSGLVEHLRGTLTVATTTANVTGADFFAAKPLSVGGAFTNQSGARLTLQNGTGRINGTGSLTNAGLITGDGVIAVPVTNIGSGDIRAESGKTLYFTSTFSGNSGDFILQGGTLDFANAITNNAAGFISGRGALNTGGLTNNGVMAFSGGNADIRGDTVNASGARIVTSGAGSVTTFYDDVVHNGLEIFTGANASTVFFGSQSGAGPFTGTGTVYFIGDLRPGNSPALVKYGGDVAFGGGATLALEIGGLLAGSEYDRLNVAGTLFADGALEVALYGGFTPHFGDTFDLFDADAVAGNFDAINLPALTGNLEWDATNLQSTGQLRVVPEPGIGALLASALGLFGMWRGRIRGAYALPGVRCDALSRSRGSQLPTLNSPLP